MEIIKRATYREIPALLESKARFTGNSCYAVSFLDEYSVYSYHTLIYREVCHKDGSKDVYFDRSYYSRTTSRLQNILRKVFNL
ncbi:MAG: hypothetical protein DBY32_11410 [Phascolarctobacterium sp.]|nr:MAG: hypothetical protein DBY32_11410 [Phascolarctobacterium sp.]